MASAEHNSTPPRIVIVGGGYGGAYCAAKLEKMLGRRIVRAGFDERSKEGHSGLTPNPPNVKSGNQSVEVVLLDRHNYFVFYPLVVEAGTGSLEPRHAVVSIRSFLKRATFRMAEVTNIDFERQVVQYRLWSDPASHVMKTDTGMNAIREAASSSGARQMPRRNDTGELRSLHELGYDHLVLSPGSVTLKPDVPGLKEHAFDVKGLGDVVGLRDRAIRLLEIADATPSAAARKALLHFVVVGGSFSGAEVAGEFHEFLGRAARKYPNLDPHECKVTLVERESRILRALGESLSDYAEQRMLERGIDVRTNESVREVGEDFVVLASGHRLRAHTTVWCAGIAPPPLLARLSLPCDVRGYVLCERDCRVKGMANVWAIGDAAVNIDQHGKAYPATAQHAVRQGEHVARSIVNVLRGKPVTSFDYTTQGTLAALGCRTGVAQIFGFRLSGFPAWWMWRSVYLMKMPGLTRKLRLMIDWTLALFFKQDDVQLGVHRSEHE